LNFLDFQFPTAEFGLAKEIEDQSRKAFFCIFLSSYAKMSFWGSKKRQVSKTVFWLYVLIVRSYRYKGKIPMLKAAPFLLWS
jgi:hypothetical protein